MYHLKSESNLRITLWIASIDTLVSCYLTSHLNFKWLPPGTRIFCVKLSSGYIRKYFQNYLTEEEGNDWVNKISYIIWHYFSSSHWKGFVTLLTKIPSKNHNRWGKLLFLQFDFGDWWHLEKPKQNWESSHIFPFTLFIVLTSPISKTTSEACLLLMIFVGIDTGIDNGNNKNEEIRESRGERRDGCVESHFTITFTILLNLTILLYFSLSGHSVILLQRSSSTNT